jgi:Flp pilus assembly CpaE family ATPase
MMKLTDVYENLHLRMRAPSGGKIHAVVGAGGSCGVSTLSAALAQSLEKSTLLADLQFSGGVDVLLGIEKMEGIRWSTMLKHPVKSKILREKCPNWSGISDLSHDRTNTNYDFNKAISLTLSAADEFDAVVLDIPSIFLANSGLLTALDSLTILVPKTVGGISNARTILHLVNSHQNSKKIAINIVLTAQNLPKRTHLLSTTNIEKLLGISVVDELKYERLIRANIDSGNGPKITDKTRLYKLVEKLKL